MRCSLIAVVIAAGCGGPAGSEIDAPAGADGDGGTDGGIDAAFDAAIDAPGTTVDGPPATSCPAGTWCTEVAPIPTTTDLRSVYVRDSADVFAVGNGGVIIRRQNDVWTQMTSGTTANLLGVWAANANDAWAVGAGGTVLRWNGTSWAPAVGHLNIDYKGVWGSGPNDVWLIGTARIQRWTGSNWATPVTVSGTPNNVDGTGPNDVWFAMEPGYLRHYTGTWATVMPGGPGVDVTQYAVEAISPTNVWATAPGSGSRNWNGTAWTAHASSAFLELHAFGAGDLWGINQGVAGHWNGTAWSNSTPFGTSSARSVSGAGGHLWIVGSGAMILHRTFSVIN